MKRKATETAGESTRIMKKRRMHSEEQGRDLEELVSEEELLSVKSPVDEQNNAEGDEVVKAGEENSVVSQNAIGPGSSDESSLTRTLQKFRQTIVTKDIFVSRFKLPNLPRADVYYMPKLVEPSVATKWYQELLKLDTWYRPTLKVYGRDVRQNRSIAAYATSPQLTAKYSNHIVQMNYHYPPILQTIQHAVEEALGVGFDHCMLNWYQDGSENIGKHRDTKENQASSSSRLHYIVTSRQIPQVIASLSLGAERTFIFVPTKPIEGTTGTKFMLMNGSLLVMQGKTQDHWKHEIPKEPKIKEGRISLTFRQLVHEK